MSKLTDFLKENWKGALICGLVYIFSFLTLNFDFLLSILFSPFYLPVIVLILLSEIWDFIAWIVGFLVWIFIGGYIQSKIKNLDVKKKIKFFGWFTTFYLIIILVYIVLLSQSTGPGRTLPSRCHFDPNFECQDYNLTLQSLELSLKYLGNDEIYLEGINLLNSNGYNYKCMVQNINFGNWRHSEIRKFEFNDCDFKKDDIRKGQKKKILMDFKYTDNGISKTIEGELYSTVK